MHTLTLESTSDSVPGKSGHKGARVDLGLAILSVTREPGRQYTQREIAAWCDCSRNFIGQIEERALAKVRAILEHHLGGTEATKDALGDALAHGRERKMGRRNNSAEKIKQYT